MRTQLNTAIYKRYKVWALSKAWDFKQFHRHKCRHIPKEELELYAIKGLVQAIKRYKGCENGGSTQFINYASYYLNGELYAGLTKLQPICSVSPSIRRKSRKNIDDDEYKVQMNTLFVGKEDWKLEMVAYADPKNLEKVIEQEEYRNFWQYIKSNFATDEFWVFQYKYDFYLNRIRTNSEVGKIMGYSEEWVRKIYVGSLEKIEFYPKRSSPSFVKLESV